MILVYTQATDGTWQGRGIEVQQDGTLALGTAKTTSAPGEVGALKKQLVQPFAPGGTTPEGSALYSPHEIHSELTVRHANWGA